jgi:hypothetical protein
MLAQRLWVLVACSQTIVVARPALDDLSFFVASDADLRDGDAETQGNAVQLRTRRAQDRESVSQALDRKRCRDHRTTRISA